MQPYLSHDERAHLLDAFDSTWISSTGEYIDLVESLDIFCARTFNLLVSNGTDALELAIKSILPLTGQQILCPSVTFSATANAIINTGNTPVFYQQLYSTSSFEPDYDMLESYVKANSVSALVLVHLYGECCDLRKAQSFCSRNNLLLIEDCAEAPFALDLNGLLCGSAGDASTFSFYANKLITCGEGGLVSFKSDSAYQLAKKIRAHGMESKGVYSYSCIGSNYRLTNLQAALLYPQCIKKDMIIAKRYHLLNQYRTLVKDTWDILPRSVGMSKPSPWFCIAIPKSVDNDHIAQISETLTQSLIEHRALFTPLPSETPFCNFPRIIDTTYSLPPGFMLPLHHNLQSDAIFKICDILNNGL